MNKFIKHKQQVAASHYEKEGLSSLRVDSLAHQVREIAFSKQENILEVGVGGGLIKQFLSLFPTITHTSLDIAADLNPDYIGSVMEMPFADNAFDLTLCCQVLEHIPFQDFLPSLKEIHRVTRHRVVLSLPDQRRRIALMLCLPKIHWQRWVLNYRLVPSTTKDRDHQWEIGVQGSSGTQVKQTILQAGFEIEREYRLAKHSWHCFYILNPIKD
jgi:ubiquinone/menaquinone biosynthesis C-methylase UbiE